MARIKKYGITYNQPLSSYGTFILDTEPNSKYFKITEFKDTLTGGKNGFLIEGSEHLMQNTEIKIEVLDVEGNSLYVEYGNGIPEYYEGTSKIAAVHVYEDTPIGAATITILGELKTYLDEGGVVLDIPEEWRGNYNIKWTKSFKINRLLSNEDKVRFYKRPKVDITEIVKPVFATTFANVTQKGKVTGTAISPPEGQFLNSYNLPTLYKLATTDDTFWTASIVGTTLNFDGGNYTPLVDSVVNSRELLVTLPYVDNATGLVSSLDEIGYTASFNYLEGVANIASALTGSFAKINLTNLETFVGDVARVKIFRKSQSQIGDYQFIQEVKLETSELLVDLESQKSNLDNYGLFTQDVIKNYWVTSSNSITAEFNQNYLYNSTKLSSITPDYFFTTKSLSIIEGNEYTLNFNTRLEANASPNNYLRVFLSGSRTSVNNGVPSTVGVEQTITTIKSSNSLLQKTTSIDNLKAEQLDNARLYFEVKGTGWYISNISFTLAQETAFSPDAISFIQSVPRNLPVETFDYRFEFYDINNNYIPVLVEQTKTFNGGNIQNLQKSLVFSPRNLIFQFDSGSNPVPPTVVGFSVTKNLLTGSVTYTSQSYDFDGTELTYDNYTASGRFPGLLSDLLSDSPSMTVGNFTGSRGDKLVQIVKITGETEGYTDTVIFTKVLDGFGGVNHLIRPYRGTDIRNSSTQSLEIQAVRIDGINDIELSSTTKPEKGWPVVQLHVLSASADKEYFINIEKAVAQNFIQGVSVGELGSKELNYNAVFNRDSIDKRRTIYLIKSGSITEQPAYIASASILSSIVLSDFQDGLDAGFVAYDTDIFNINFRNDINFSPITASVTASFYLRGSNSDPLTASLTVFPSMSINKDFVPEYWVYFVTHSSTWNKDITITATDDNNNIIKSGGPNSFYGSYVRSPLSQSKTITTNFKYTEPYTLTEVTVDKTFTIVPAGKPGDESIIFEFVPQNVSLKANAKGEVNSYQPSISDIRLKQGSRYLSFTSSISESGTFYIAQSSITSSNITGGLVYFDNRYTSSLIVSASSGLVNLSGSVTYPLIIHPYYTSSIYTQSIVQNYTKVMDGPPPIQIILSPASVTLNADEVGYVGNYSAANTTIQVKDGEEFLKFTTTESFANAEAAKGTFRISNGASVVPTNIQVASIATGSNINTGLIRFNRFDYPFVSASAVYNIVAFPYSLGPGHQYTSSIFQRTQAFSKSVAPSNSRNVDLSATSTTVNFDGDGVITSPLDPVILTATATNTTGAVWYQFFKNDIDYTGIQSENAVEIGGGDAVSPGETATWSVKIRDGNNSPSALVRAQSSLSIAGIKAGSTAYNIILTNENSSALYKVSGEITFTGTGTQLRATKGDIPLLHKTDVLRSGPGFSPKTTDQFGNDIGSIGEYQVSVFSKSSHITLAGNLSGSQTLSTFNDIATIVDILSWDSPETNPIAEIVYEVNLENGRLLAYKTQSLSIQYEGATGPGIVMRGEWSGSINYSGSVETNNYRRDAVIYGTNPTKYYAAVSGSGPQTYNGAGTIVGAQQPTANGDNAYWQYLGEQEFFVAAKIAIFDESYVKNTINVGNNPGSAFANIVLAGGRTDPYMAIGQYANIGYGNSGIWQGIYTLPAGAGLKPRFSLVNSDDSRHLKWTGDDLQIKGSITVTGGDAATQAGVTGSALSAVATAAGNTTTAINLFSGSLGAMAAIDSIEAGSPVTYIGAGVIVTGMIATNALVSTNYSYTSGNFTTAGSFFNLANGEIISPGFSVKANGDAYFKGTITATGGTLGTWNLDDTRIWSSNNRITLNAATEAITVLDTTGNLRFSANTNPALPEPGGAAPNTTGISIPTLTNMDYESSNGSPISHTGKTYYDFGNFITSAGDSKHLVSWQYNPVGSGPFQSYIQAQGDASSWIGIRLVLRNHLTGAVLFTGTEVYKAVYGSVECDGGPYRVSVVGDTEIILADGSIKLAKDILENDKILSWDSNKNEFTEGVVVNFRNRDVDFVYVVVCDGKLVKVSDSHTFWTYGTNDETPVQELIAGKSKIYVKVGNTIQLKLVDDVYKLDTNEKVYSFTVPNFKNYVSNNIISHNIDYPGGCMALGDIQYFTDPTNFTLEADLTGNSTYKLSLEFDKYVESTNTISAGFTSYARALFKVTATAASIQRVSAGTTINGGGFQSITSDAIYIRHMTSPTLTNIGTYINGGLMLDKQYHPSTIGTNLGYNVAGYPMVKGYGRWTMSNVWNTNPPVSPGTAAVSIGGAITSLTIFQIGKYIVSYNLANSAGGVSTTIPSVFIQGTRDDTSDTECTFNYGKRSGSSTQTIIHTQDNNTDTLNNLDEFSALLVM